MQKINSEADLKEAILQLETKQLCEGKMLKTQFKDTFESIKPINLIKNTFKQAAASTELKDNILVAGVGLTAGIITKKIFVGASHGLFKNLFGTALMMGISKIVAQNPDKVKMLGNKFFNLIGRKPSKDALAAVNIQKDPKESTF